MENKIKMPEEECRIDNEDIIDNEHHMLIDHLRSVLPVTRRASIAVGYFFLSGFAEIMDNLTIIEKSDNPDDKIRLLISPTTNKVTAEVLLASNEDLDTVKRKIENEEIVESQELNKIREQVKKTLEYMPQTEKDQLAAKKIIWLIQKNKLEVKVYTKEQLHAKAYIFELDNAQLPKMAIIGSSNLSISGIKEHTELNIKTKSAGDVNGLLQWFDCHWNDKSCKEFTKDIADIIDNSWIRTENSPDDVYDKASWHEHSRITGSSEILEFEDVDLFHFQKNAINDAIKKLEEYNGVIIADVVGTGKSYIGCAILKHLREHEHVKPLVICPPHLCDMWMDLLIKFNVYGEVESRFKIGMDEKILENYTHCDVILIDESHNFRHQNTNAYKALSIFMEEKTDDAKIIMLTATPISNTIHDLKNQLKLFPVEGLEKIPALGSRNLDDYFKGLESSTKEVSREGVIKIQELLKYILIRRTRTQIINKYAKKDGDRYFMDLNGVPKYFPKRKLQHPEEYDADKVYNNSFELIENAIETLHLARYIPGKYIKKKYLVKDKYADLASVSKPMSGIVRTSLLKRMESSIQAFDTSIKNYQRGYRLFKRQLGKGIVPIGKEFKDAIYKKIDDDYDDDYEDISKIKSDYDINAFNIDLWKKEIDEDLNKFAEITRYLSGESYIKRDDKLHKLYDLIKDRNEKILIFSESAETVNYIHAYLNKIFETKTQKKQVERINSKLDQRTKTMLMKRFDPDNNNARDIVSERDEIDILVSTDVLSEGVNLQAGKTIINYDFHWNPVRLIQRVGRLDRIGSKHSEINIFNFLPTTKIDKTLSLQSRVAEKIKTIRKIIGTDQQILTATEVIDGENVSKLYDPDNNNDMIDAEIEDVLLDMEETESEKYANEINKDDEKKEYVEKLPFGIRGITGSDKLIIACEAEKSILNQNDKDEQSRLFRKHYEITRDGNVSEITPSYFLKLIANNRKNTGICTEAQYNNLVGIAWKKFSRDIKNESAKNMKRKHQLFFENKLTHIATHNKELSERSKRLQPFVISKMRHTHQPYRSLAGLHRKIDHRITIDEEFIIKELEKIHAKYNHIRYRTLVRKPRILYSMMVRT